MSSYNKTNISYYFFKKEKSNLNYIFLSQFLASFCLPSSSLTISLSSLYFLINIAKTETSSLLSTLHNFRKRKKKSFFFSFFLFSSPFLPLFLRRRRSSFSSGTAAAKSLLVNSTDFPVHLQLKIRQPITKKKKIHQNGLLV